MELPKRKNTRLKCYDYDTPGYMFVTLCTEEKKKLLCDIVGTGLPDGPRIYDTAYGKVARKQLEQMADFYDGIRLEKYVIMPNHIHLLLRIMKTADGPSGRPVPTQNTRVSKFIGTFKRFCNREYGRNIWQYRSHDHVIRNERDYRRIWTYIDGNPARWKEDCFYCED